MRFVFLGPPGAGKGTQAKLLSEKYHIAHISTGDLLRSAVKENSKLGTEARAYMDRGELVPDAIVIALIKTALEGQAAKKGFILDGFPRNVAQARVIARELTAIGEDIEAVCYFKTSEAIVITRLTGRRVCGACGRNYHIKNMPPRKDSLCDDCQKPLLQRQDDKEEVIKNRLKVYEETTKSLIDHYTRSNKLIVVDGDLEVKELLPKLCAIFEKYA